MGDNNESSNDPIKLISLDNLSTYHDLMDAKKEDHSVTLTLAQYNALSPEEKMNGKTYYISDAGSSGMVITASDVLMTGYSKASSASAITTNDTGSIAFGKLEKGLDDVSSDVDDINNLIPSTATVSNKLATASDIPAVTGNPEGSATAGNLTKLQIGSDIYDVPSGGGSSDPYDGRKTRYTISSSNWSSSPNSSGYYTYSLTLTNPLTTTTSPNVYIAGSGDNTEPTATEKTMFGYVKRCNLSSSTTLVLYATTKPTSTFYVFVGAEGGSGTLDYSYVVSNVSFTANAWTKIGDYTFPSTGIYALGLYPSGGSNNPKASMITYSDVTDPSALGTNDGYLVYAESGTVTCNCSCIKNCVANTKINLFVKSNTTAINSVRVVVTRLADMA